MLSIFQTKKESKNSVSFKVRISVIQEFKKLAKLKGFSQATLIENAMIMLIEEMKKMEDKK
ncbi:MAG: hypothetical protein KU29_13970 [Sulfurovum sp. FS06-10]|jgi:hypothetical protein|nr:MAG: hypothetical protein KU29_13970 [Sulfurovum sp. FS06-10]